MLVCYNGGLGLRWRKIVLPRKCVLWSSYCREEKIKGEGLVDEEKGKGEGIVVDGKEGRT